MATHVIPDDELVGHDRNGDCPCGPYAEPVKRVDGSMGWLVIHRALDGREPRRN